MARGEEMPQSIRLTCGHVDMFPSNIILNLLSPGCLKDIHGPKWKQI